VLRSYFFSLHIIRALLRFQFRFLDNLNVIKGVLSYLYVRQCTINQEKRHSGHNGPEMFRREAIEGIDHFVVLFFKGGGVSIGVILFL